MSEEYTGCYRCGREEDEVLLLDAISGTEIVKICQECSVIEDMPIVNLPDANQLKESEKPYTVYERLSKMAGLSQPSRVKKEPEFISKRLTIEKLRPSKEYNMPKERFEEAKPEPLQLVDNFNWFVQVSRRRAKLSQKQLAEAIQVDEQAIKQIEEGYVVGGMAKIVSKLEQCLKVKLQKGKDYIEPEKPIEKPVRDNWAYVKDPLVKAEFVLEDEEAKKIQVSPSVLRFDKDAIKKFTIDDLRKMKSARDSVKKDIDEKEIHDIIWNRKKGKKEMEIASPSQETAEEILEDVEEEEEKPGFWKRLFKKKKKVAEIDETLDDVKESIEEE